MKDADIPRRPGVIPLWGEEGCRFLGDRLLTDEGVGENAGVVDLELPIATSILAASVSSLSNF